MAGWAGISSQSVRSRYRCTAVSSGTAKNTAIRPTGASGHSLPQVAQASAMNGARIRAGMLAVR